MDVNDLEFLVGNTYFSNHSRDDLLLFSENLDVVSFSEGDTLFAEGESDFNWYLIIDGEVSISRESLHGPPHTLAELGSGEAFGEMALLEKTPRMASAVAVTEVRVLQLTSESFDKLLKNRDSVAVGMVREMAIAQCQRLREITTILQEITDTRAIEEAMPKPNPLDLNTLIRSGLLLN